MNEEIKNACGCNPCTGPRCACGCQDTVAPEACGCGAECRCGDACGKVEANA
jgi:hypothetical protein